MNTIKKKNHYPLSLVIHFHVQTMRRLSNKKDIKVLIVGNSILRHMDLPHLLVGRIGYVAAASPDKDFLHVYNKLLQVSDKYNYVNMYSKI
jgi:hypothetical protein